MEEKKACTVVNHYYGCYGGNGTSNDGTPVGTVISYMGTNTPEHYLACDGTIYNIDDYKDFSQFIKDQFGSYDYFGGDGTTTFAVPDLRGEFLRGAGAASRSTGSGATVGMHQDPTRNPFTTVYASGSAYALGIDFPALNTPNPITDYDTAISNNGNRVYKDISLTPIQTSSTKSNISYTSRPTNTAVLYCIKYE